MALYNGGNSTLLGGGYPFTAATPGWETGNYGNATLGNTPPPNAASTPGTSSGAQAFAQAAPFLMALGAVQSMVGTYYQSQSQKYQLEAQQLNLEFNSKMAMINARNAERTAQQALLQGERAIGQVTMRAGKVKSAQKAAMAANGIDIGVGSAAEVQATTDLMKENDAITIDINRTLAANSARTQGVNFQNSSLLSGVSAANAGAMADAVSPWSNAAASLISNAGSVASSWYNSYSSSRLERRLAQLASV